jgi:hypothetical protein
VTFRTIVAEERHASHRTGAAFLPNFQMTFGTLGRSARRLFNMTDKSRDPTAERRAFECITRAYEEAAALLRDHLDSSTHAECGRVGATSAIAAIGGRSL